MLRRVQLRNFRGFWSLDASCGEVTGIIGKNSSGKTSVLHAVRIVTEALVGQAIDAANHDRGLEDAAYEGRYPFHRRPDPQDRIASFGIPRALRERSCSRHRQSSCSCTSGGRTHCIQRY
jgi:predicted ATPase